jgi:transcriptional regulator with GAF, ATPase, and Fis domain
MPGASNTLLIEGTFSELAEELAQYLDNLAKSEEGAGVVSDSEQLLNSIREAEQSEDADEASLQSNKDEVLKKIVTKAAVLNSAPERGRISTQTDEWTTHTDQHCRIHGSVQPPHQLNSSILNKRSDLCQAMPVPLRRTCHVLSQLRRSPSNSNPHNHIQCPAVGQ